MDVLIEYKGASIVRDDVVLLREVNLELRKGEFLYIIGNIGSGKSSLLQSMYVDAPIEGGTAMILDYDLHRIKEQQIPFLRRKIGIVFQDNQLLYDRSVYENLNFVLRATDWKDKNAIDERINEVLEQVNMADKAHKMPHLLSGGEQQRIVIARALLNSPDLILADEPTGNLDPETADRIVQLLQNICQHGTSVIMTTHNHQFIKNYPGKVLVCENEQLTISQHSSL